jgi:hypothetical protein
VVDVSEVVINIKMTEEKIGIIREAILNINKEMIEGEMYAKNLRSNN